ncbi:MAG: DUF309 domain-containing protein [bacterium]
MVERLPIQRYAPQRAFPPYAYITGRAPHPRRDPRGHSFGAPEPPPAAFDVARWRECDDYLFGVDLFNHGYYWEAHEAWEGLWRASRDADRARAAAARAAGDRHDAGASAATLFLQALIKFAAAGFKARQGRAAGLRRHASVAAALFAEVEKTDRRFMGLLVAELISRAVEIAALDGAHLDSLCCDDALIFELAPA